jgi:nucleoside-diphosphate-sugar epimerase
MIFPLGKYLVTGSAGFLGSELLNALKAQGLDCVGLDISSQDNTTVVDCSDLKSLLPHMQNVDFVINTIAYVPLRRPTADFHTANSLVPGVIAKAAAQSQVKKVIHISSSAVWGLPGTSLVKEETIAKPFEPYGKAKLLGEDNFIREIKQTPWAILRPRTILGNGRLGIFHTLFTFIKEDRSIYTIGKGSHPLQFIDIEDVITAIATLLSQGQGIYAVGSTNYSSIKSELNSLIAFGNSNSKIRPLPKHLAIIALSFLWKLRLSPLSPWHIHGYANPFHLSSEKLIQLGWSPKFSNIQTLQRSWEWFLFHSDEGINSVHRSPLKLKLLDLLRRFS